jgi:hypothetical protein
VSHKRQIEANREKRRHTKEKNTSRVWNHMVKGKETVKD